MSKTLHIKEYTKDTNITDNYIEIIIIILKLIINGILIILYIIQ